MSLLPFFLFSPLRSFPLTSGVPREKSTTAAALTPSSFPASSCPVPWKVFNPRRKRRAASRRKGASALIERPSVARCRTLRHEGEFILTRVNAGLDPKWEYSVRDPREQQLRLYSSLAVYTVSPPPLRFVAALLSDRRSVRPFAIFTQQFAVQPPSASPSTKRMYVDGSQFSCALNLPQNVTRGCSIALARDYSVLLTTACKSPLTIGEIAMSLSIDVSRQLSG